MEQSRSELKALARSLAFELRGYARRPDVVVLARQPDVVPLAAEVALALGVPLDLFLVRPLVLFDGRRLEIGVVASGGVLVLDSETVRAHGVSAAAIATAAQAGARALARREQAWRGDQPPLDLRHRKVIVVDDGRSGAPALRMSVAALRRRWVERVVLTAPTMQMVVCDALLVEADEIITALTSEQAAAGPSSIGDDTPVCATEIARLSAGVASPLPSAS